ncbi:MAG: peptidase M23 [Thalassobius sp.]|nr:peptidase M23 [Thalassovita sp.]
MAKAQYYYNTETCTYEKIEKSKFEGIIKVIGLLFVCVIFGSAFAWAIITSFDSPYELELIQKNENLLFNYHHLDKELKSLQDHVVKLQRRDDEIYRPNFEVEPIPKEIRQAGAGGSQKYKNMLREGLENEGLIITYLSRLDLLKRQMYIQSQSLDEVSELAKTRKELMSHLPAIQPVSNKELKRLASGFGMRFHPILGVTRMHPGCDFSAPTGTPIYATGDGKIIKAEKGNYSYGNQIEIDHGFGYITKYGHMSTFEVEEGQEVKRGQIIGHVGNTGLSTAPHCHYEVIFNDKKVNPVDYFLNDLTDEEYEEIIRLSSEETAPLGF